MSGNALLGTGIGKASETLGQGDLEDSPEVEAEQQHDDGEHGYKDRFLELNTPANCTASGLRHHGGECQGPEREHDSECCGQCTDYDL